MVLEVTLGRMVCGPFPMVSGYFIKLVAETRGSREAWPAQGTPASFFFPWLQLQQDHARGLHGSMARQVEAINVCEGETLSPVFDAT